MIKQTTFFGAEFPFKRRKAMWQNDLPKKLLALFSSFSVFTCTVSADFTFALNLIRTGTVVSISTLLLISPLLSFQMMILTEESEAIAFVQFVNQFYYDSKK